MPVARRSMIVPAAPDAVWRIVGDPNHQPRWWPKVRRVEGVEGGSFTRVYGTSKGRPVRADFTLVEDDPPRARRWEQVIPGSPFERLMHASQTAVRVEPADGGARVTLEVTQRLRGLSKFGGWLVRRATRKQLDEALDTLETLL
jgi:uncharacterized protein YndB with AHSA1/START domain